MLSRFRNASVPKLLTTEGTWMTGKTMPIGKDYDFPSWPVKGDRVGAGLMWVWVVGVGDGLMLVGAAQFRAVGKGTISSRTGALTK
jgi:hypothetical protein